MSDRAAAALSLTGLSKEFGGLRAVDGVSLTVVAGERRAIIGPNGAGKTTLFSLISGEARPTGGRIEVFQQRGHRVGLGRREPGGRLVEQQEPGRTGQGQGDLELTLLSVRQIPHRLGLLVGEPDRVEHTPGTLVEGRVAWQRTVDVELGGGQRLDRQEAVLERGEAREEIGDLVRARQTEAGSPVRRVARDVMSGE